MQDSKPVWASKTLYANLIGAIAAIGTAFGLDLGLGPEEQTAIVGGIMAAVNVALRFVTSKPLGKPKGYQHIPKAKAHPLAVIAALGLALMLAGCAGNQGERDVVNIGDGKLFGRDVSGFFDSIINASAEDARRAEARATAFGDTVGANCWGAVADAAEKAQEASAGVDSSEVGPLEKYQVARNVRIMLTDSASPVGVWCRAMVRDSIGAGAGLVGKVVGF